MSTQRVLAPDISTITAAFQTGGPTGPAHDEARATILIVRDAEGAAFATDGSARIVAWNNAAEQLLGHKASAVRGRTVSEVVQSRDLFGNRIPCECGTQEMIRRGEPIRRHVVVMTTASGDARRVVLDIEAATSARTPAPVVYHLRPDSRQDRRAFDAARLPDGHAAALTPAELKVLRVLAGGKRAQDAATSLGVSLTTVRNHIQHIFRKLKVHNQLEAVSLALRNGLV